MGTISDVLACIVCNSEAITEFNYKTGEEFVHCKECGYHRRFYITNWSEQGSEGWTPEYEIFECKEPFGAFEVRYKNGMGECGSFIEKENEEEFMDQVEELIDEIESATIKKYVDGKLETIVVVEPK